MIYISAAGLLNALGNSPDEVSENLLLARAPGMGMKPGWLVDGSDTWLGSVNATLPQIPDDLQQHHSRNNQLLLGALQQITSPVETAIARYGADRVAIVMGTSTSGIAEGEQALKHFVAEGEFPAGYAYQQQELGDPAQFLARYLGISGPAYTLSTACTSSARAIISGKRLIDAGLVDVALVGGADSLCQMAINGFNSLESLSATQCTPFAADRKGINIGEAAALMLLTREPADIALLGVGESSDAWHMSAPHPQGEGAERAIRMALDQAGISAEQVGYINLHGTATPLNDSAEAQAINRVFGAQVPCSSTKHLTGHTLGAAGATEAVLCWLILTRQLPLPVQDFTHAERDLSLADIDLLTSQRALASPIILSNSFAFGGNNACILLGNSHE